MREYKFRCWDKIIETMTDWEKLSENDYLSRHIEWPERKIIMQFTGLLDKNGKEIYEGDIVTAPKKDGTKIMAPVVFYHGHFMMTKTKTLKKWRSLGHKSNKDQLEVIGNIYEHDHFLK